MLVVRKEREFGRVFSEILYTFTHTYLYNVYEPIHTDTTPLSAPPIYIVHTHTLLIILSVYLKPFTESVVVRVLIIFFLNNLVYNIHCKQKSYNIVYNLEYVYAKDIHTHIKTSRVRESKILLLCRSASLFEFKLNT